jgi:RHS repeat-associated protein
LFQRFVRGQFMRRSAFSRTFPRVFDVLAKLKTASILAPWLLMPVVSYGQITNASADQAPPVPAANHDYIQELNETVNPANGSLSIRIDVPAPKGREITIPFAFEYDSNSAHHFIGGDIGQGEVDESWTDNYSVLGRGGWSYDVPVLEFGQSYRNYSMPNQPPPTACYFYSGYSFLDPASGAHTFTNLKTSDSQQVCEPYWAGTYIAADQYKDGDAKFLATTSALCAGCHGPAPPVSVFGQDGTVYYFSNTHFHVGGSALPNNQSSLPDWVETTNGNKVTYTDQGNGAFTETDSAGRPAITSSGFGTTGNTVQVAGLTKPYTLTWQNQPYSMQITSSPLETAPPTGGEAACVNPSSGTEAGSQPEITQISLPDGTSYQFQYDPTTGLVNKLIYPTGAYVRYVWTSVPESTFLEWDMNITIQNSLSETTPYTNFPPQCEALLSTPAIQSRFVSFDGAKEVQEQDFTYGPVSWGQLTYLQPLEVLQGRQTTVITKDKVRGTQYQTIYTYGALPPDDPPPCCRTLPAYTPVETQVQVYDTNNHLLRTVNKSYVANELPPDETVVLPPSTTSFTHLVYAAQPVGVLPTDTYQYDYGNGSYGPLLRHTHTDYQTFSVSPLGSTIADKPADVITYDGNNNRVAETDYLYDKAGILPISALGQDSVQYPSSVEGPRGNATLVTKVCFIGATNCANQTTAYVYDQAGLPETSTDAKGYRTTYSYSDAYTQDDGTPSGNTYARLTSITRPPVNGVNFVSTFTYGYLDGKMRTAKDENGQVTSYCYLTEGCSGTAFEPWFRLKETDYPDGGRTSISYSDAGPNPSVISTTLATPDPSISKTVIYDAIGHELHSQLTTDPAGADYVDTVYDGVGETYSISNPYRSTSDSTYGVTTYTYDPLGRILLETHPDQSTLQFSYSANVTTSIDEAGNSWLRTSDALGRLTNVQEPTNASTGYGYNALDDLTNVNQLGVGGETPVTRKFSYDSLSQLVIATNPESGTVCYGNSSSGTCIDGYDSDGNLGAKTDARGVTTSYNYDALNRVQSKSYSDGTPGSSYTYDTFTGWGQPHGSSIGRMVRSHTCYSYSCEDDLYGYDQMGRMNHIEGTTPSEEGNSSHWTGFQYDLAGNATGILYPDGRILSQTFDGSGHINNVTYSTQSAGYGQWSGTAVNSPYVSNISYSPNGSPETILYGNGVTETLSQNNRLQTCEISATLPSSVGGMTVLDRQYYWSYDGGVVCATNPGNNGNIWYNIDNVDQTYAKAQFAQYDGVNRIISWQTGNMAGSSRSQNFSYDSFGNVTQTNGGNMPNFPSVSPGYDANNHLVAGSFGCASPSGAIGINPNNPGYDLSGNVLCTGAAGYTAQAYLYDPEGKVTSVYNQLGSNTYNLTNVYSYDGQGERIRKDQGAAGSTQFTEYVYANGQVLAQKDQSGNWADNIYANGKKIAQVAPTDTALHITGTATCGNCGASIGWGLDLSAPLIGYVVKAGDKLNWRQYESSTAQGGVSQGWFFDCGAFNLPDTTGENMRTSSVQNAWVQRTVDLTPVAGCTFQAFGVGALNITAPGEWDMWFADMALDSSDGSVMQLTYRQTGSPTFYEAFNITNYNIFIDSSTVPPGGAASQNTVAYSLSDQVGTTQILLSGGGWPVWKGEFSPFGQELDTQYSPDNYKFTGKERDAESGLDYFGARYYGSSMGRFMSPDWSEKQEPVPYARLADPQSLNLYTYGMNNPLSMVDDDGHFSKDVYVADNDKHGGPHIDRYNKQGQNVGRYRPDGTPMRHNGKTPDPVPNSDKGKFEDAKKDLNKQQMQDADDFIKQQPQPPKPPLPDDLKPDPTPPAPTPVPPVTPIPLPSPGPMPLPTPPMPMPEPMPMPMPMPMPEPIPFPIIAGGIHQ